MVISQVETAASVIERFVRKQFRIDETVPSLRDLHLFESGFVDSAGVVELIAFLETTFAIQLGDDEMFNDDFTTINGIARIVEKAASRQGRGGGTVPAMSTLIVLLAAVLAACSDRPAPALAEARWPNEPPGLEVLADWGLDQEPPQSGDVEIPGSPGWSIVYGTPPGPDRGWVRRVRDDSAPMSPPFVYEFEYPQGMVEGVAPGTVYFPRSPSGIAKFLPSPSAGLPGADEIYVGFWWKPSKPFDVGPNGNKIAFLFNGAGDRGGQQFLILHTDGKLHVLPEYPGDFQWRRPLPRAAVVRLGEWHRVEWYAKLSTGTLKWWLDGELHGSHDDVRNPHKFDMFQFSPTWGGASGAKKRQTDHYWFDHLRLSVGR